MQEAYGALGFTPEMSTCESASDVDPDDEWEAEDCESGFNFPDDEGLIQAEFEKNIPFALAVAESAADPDDPVSVVGIDTPNFVVDSFDVSYGDPQTVAVTAKRDARRDLLMNYRINGGRTRDRRPASGTAVSGTGSRTSTTTPSIRGEVQRCGGRRRGRGVVHRRGDETRTSAAGSRANTSRTPSPATPAAPC